MNNYELPVHNLEALILEKRERTALAKIHSFLGVVAPPYPELGRYSKLPFADFRNSREQIKSEYDSSKPEGLMGWEELEEWVLKLPGYVDIVKQTQDQVELFLRFRDGQFRANGETLTFTEYVQQREGIHLRYKEALWVVDWESYYNSWSLMDVLNREHENGHRQDVLRVAEEMGLPEPKIEMHIQWLVSGDGYESPDAVGFSPQVHICNVTEMFGQTPEKREKLIEYNERIIMACKDPSDGDAAIKFGLNRHKNDAENMIGYAPLPSTGEK